MIKKPWIEPQWSAASNIHAISTIRQGGVSQSPWESLNLGDHVNDDPSDVAENRRRLRRLAGLPHEPQWLTQVHGCDITEITESPPAGGCEADAAYTNRPGCICAVLTADCLPVLFVDMRGREVAAAHAGWRGLAGGVLEQTVGRFAAAPQTLLAWLGPAIGPASFEVGAEVREKFLKWSSDCETAFVQHEKGRWLADIYQLARLRLRKTGITAIYGGDYCTYRDAERFYSYRRDGETGRVATLIWFSETQQFKL
jgi:YfiH family protein